MTACSPLARTDQTVGSGTSSRQRKARIVAHVKTGSCWFRKQFYQACRQLGLDALEVPAASVELTAEERESLKIPIRGNHSADAQWITVFVVSGTPEALAEFAQRPCVQDAYPVLHGLVPCRGTGWGEQAKRQPHPMDWRFDLIRACDDAADEEWLRLRNAKARPALGIVPPVWSP